MLSSLTDGLGIHLLLIGSGLLYVGEYLPGKQAPVDVIGPCKPVGPLELIILSGEYITFQNVTKPNHENPSQREFTIPPESNVLYQRNHSTFILENNKRCYLNNGLCYWNVKSAFETQKVLLKHKKVLLKHRKCFWITKKCYCNTTMLFKPNECCLNSTNVVWNPTKLFKQ